MTSRQSSASASQPGSSPVLKQQQPQQMIATSPRITFMTPPDNNNNCVTNYGANNNNNVGSTLPPGVANPLGGMALPLALLAQHQQQLQMAAAVAGNQQGPPIYIYPPGIQPFPCYFPGAPLPYPHPGAGPGGPFSPNAATTAAIMAAMTAGVPHQNNQPLPGSPFFTAPGIGTPLTPVFRFNQPQTPQPLPLPQPQQQQQQQQQQQTSNNLTGGLPPPGLQQHVIDQAGENRRTITKTSIGVGHDGVLSPPSNRLLLTQSAGMGSIITNGNDNNNNNNIAGNASSAVPVNSNNNNNNNNNSIATNNNANLPPHFNTANVVATNSNAAATPSPHQHHHSTSSSLTSPKQALVITSPPGVNPASLGQHVIRQNPLSSHDNNAQIQQQQQQAQQQHHHHHHPSDQQQQQQASNSSNNSNSTSNRQRKRPPNLTIPMSNFDVPPANSSMGSDAGTGGWPPNTPGGTNSGPIPKTPKTAPSFNTVAGSSNSWQNQRTTPRGGLHGIAACSSAGPRQRGRPPLHHKPQINSADQVMAPAANMNGFPSVSSQNFSSSSSTYNSPNLLVAPVVNSATSYSTTGSDLSGHHQQEVVINSPSHLLYPDHFKRGSLIRLADGSFKCVEDMATSDFTRSAQLSGELQLDSSQVLQIEPNPARGAAMLYLGVGDQSPINIHVEAPLEHPFFVYNVGWSSCDPERTRARYGLAVSQLRVGDKCISLTRKPPLPPQTPVAAANTASVSSAGTLPPPPPPLSAPPLPSRRTGSGNGQTQPSQQQPTPASSAIVEPSLDDAKHEESQVSTSTSVNNKIESEAEMESIATASLLSLQQSSTKIEAVSPLRISLSAPSSSSAAAAPATTVTTTATTAVIRSTEHCQVSISPPSSSGLLILDKAETTIIREEGELSSSSSSSGKMVVVEQPSSSNGSFIPLSPKVEDQSSIASEPLVVANGVSSVSPIATVVTHENKQTATSHLKSRFPTHHVSPASKPRLLLFPGHQLIGSSAMPRPGSSSFVGLRRRRHRSTSALALAELSPKSKFIFLQKEAVQNNNNNASTSAVVKSPSNDISHHNNSQGPSPPSSSVACELVGTSTSEQMQKQQQNVSTTRQQAELPSSSANDDDYGEFKNSSEPMQVDDDNNNNSAAANLAPLSSDNV